MSEGKKAGTPPQLGDDKKRGATPPKHELKVKKIRTRTPSPPEKKGEDKVTPLPTFSAGSRPRGSVRKFSGSGVCGMGTPHPGGRGLARVPRRPPKKLDIKPKDAPVTEQPPASSQDRSPKPPPPTSS